jgi:hypothetical protein
VRGSAAPATRSRRGPPEVIRRKKNNREPHVECSGFEFLDQRLPAAGLFHENQRLEVKPFEDLRDFVA